MRNSFIQDILNMGQPQSDEEIVMGFQPKLLDYQEKHNHELLPDEREAIMTLHRLSIESISTDSLEPINRFINELRAAGGGISLDDDTEALLKLAAMQQKLHKLTIPADIGREKGEEIKVKTTRAFKYIRGLLLSTDEEFTDIGEGLVNAFAKQLYGQNGSLYQTLELYADTLLDTVGNMDIMHLEKRYLIQRDSFVEEGTPGELLDEE